MPTVQLTPFVKAQWLDNSGAPLAGGMLFTFAAGTSTPLASYTDSTGATPNPNPVVLDAAGRADVWLNSGTAYKLTMQNSLGVQQWTEDGVNPGAAPATLGTTNVAGNFSLTQPTAATALANQSSFSESIQAQYWNGAATATDQWTFQDVLGTGTNPTSTLTIAHSGSPGTSSVSFPSGTSFGSPTFTGNAVAQNLSTKTFEQVRYADQFAGADMGAKITAAIADLPGTGGIVDARAFQGAQSAAATVTITQGITALLGGVTLSLAGSPGINLAGQGAALIGMAPSATMLSTSSGTADIVQTNNGFNRVFGCSFVSSVARTAGAALRHKGYDGDFQFLTMDKTFNGIQITDSLAGATGVNRYRNITMGFGLASSGSWNAGIIIGGVTSGTISGEVFHQVNVQGSTSFADAYVVLDSGCDTIHFADCQFVQIGLGDSFSLGIRNTSTSNDPQSIRFTNCVFEPGLTKTGITVSAGALVRFLNCIVATGQNGLIIQGGKSTYFMGGAIGGMQQAAVTLTGGTDSRIMGNRIYDTSIQANGGFNAVAIAANVNDFSIISNDFTTILSSANQPFNNIAIAAGTSDRYWITGNTFANSTGGGLTDGGTGLNKFVNSNVGSTLNIFNGVPVAREIAVVDLTAQTAAIGTSTLYAVPATGAGQYRISWDSKVTTVAGVSSTLGPFTLTWTDPDGVAITTVIAGTQAGGSLTNAGLTTNTTSTFLLGAPVVVNAKASTNITYSFAYASNAASAMAYNLHIKVEAL